MNPIRQAVSEYLDLGFSPIPLNPGSKIALLAGWNLTNPAEQWGQVDQSANIGLRCNDGRGLAVLDSDDKTLPTWHNLYTFLASLGLEPGSYPVIETPNRGKHAYVSLIGQLEGNSRNFRPGFGAGEFRFGSGSYVAAPPSLIPEGEYRLVSGDFRQLPRIYAADLLPILSDQETNLTIRPERASGKPSRRALAMLDGIGIEHFATRSEAEQAILASLANSNLDFTQVLDLFLSRPAAGKFSELHQRKPRNAVKWLESSYRKAQEWTAAHESKERATARQLLGWARVTPWPGRTGSIDRAVFEAHVSIAIKAGRLHYAASSRELAELSGIQRLTATKATRRLCDIGLLALERQAVGDLSNTYRLRCIDIPLPKYCEGVVYGCNIAAHDAFRPQGLGKAAADVFSALQAGLLTVGEIEQTTGRNRVTIWRVLRRMAILADPLTGELMPMVEQVGEKWKSLDVDLDRIAETLGTKGKQAQQRARHAKEREYHRRIYRTGEESEAPKTE